MTNFPIEKEKFFLAAVVDSSKDSIVTIDFDGLITSWNKAAEHLYGYPAKEAIGSNLAMVVLPEDIRQLLINIDRIKDSESVELYDTIRIHKGGELMNLEIMLSPVKDDHHVIGVSTIARNITERVRTQNALAQSEARFRALISQTTVGIYQTDLNRIITFVNATLCNLLGFSREELMGRSMGSTTFEEDVALENRLFDDFRQTSASFEMDKRIVKNTGEVRWIKESVSPIYNQQHELESTMGVVTDIHEAKLAKELLEEIVHDRTSQLERSNADLLQFAHVASHDLKEPLRKIKIYCNRLEGEFKDDLPPNAQFYLNKIHTSAERMNSMIEGVLAYSKVNADERRIETIDLNALIKSVMEDLEIPIQQMAATIVTTPLPPLQGAPVLIHQLFYNLVNNSLKFSRRDVPPVIRITGEVMEMFGREYVLIEIADNGIGFEQRFSRQIFETFTRLNSKDKYEGTGLGLALCYKIVQRHGGTIEATGVPGEGATFKIYLPKEH